jgi:predicted nucleotide-binding protein
MQKTEALARIQKQIDAIPEVRAAGRKAPAFARWNRDTTVLLGYVFGTDHQNLEHFSSVRYSLGAISSLTPESAFVDAFNRGLSGAEAVLQSMQTEIREFWPNDSASPSGATPEARKGKPRLFIGSSVEGLKFAEALQVNLEFAAEVTVWYQGVFGLSLGTLEALVAEASGFDFAVLVLTPDDVSTQRDKTGNGPRDNVLFELGLFMGALGRERTFIVRPRDVDMQMPSDLAGVTCATFEPNRQDGNVQAAVGAPSTKVKDAISRLGRRAG